MQSLVTAIIKPHALDAVKDALFAAGAGKYRAYDRCCWQVLGMGQFRPLKGSQPFVGRHGTTEQVPEWRVEMLCPADRLAEVAAALRRAHPYEEPAFDFVRIVL